MMMVGMDRLHEHQALTSISFGATPLRPPLKWVFRSGATQRVYYSWSMQQQHKKRRRRRNEEEAEEQQAKPFFNVSKLHGYFGPHKAY